MSLNSASVVFALMALALALTISSRALAQSRPSIYLPASYRCVHPSSRVRPVSIGIGCDGGQTFEAITWMAWKPSGAIGRGTSVENTCTPSCAAGHLVKNPVAIRLLGSQLCDGVREYTRISYRYVGKHLDGITLSDTRKTWAAKIGCR